MRHSPLFLILALGIAAYYQSCGATVDLGNQELQRTAPLNYSPVCEWHHDALGTFDAWNKLKSVHGGGLEAAAGKGISIAVIDTGMLKPGNTHTELHGNNNIDYNAGYNFVENKPGPWAVIKQEFPRWYHGTNVLAIIASPRGKHPNTLVERNSPKFVTGVAPGARLIPIRAMNQVVYLQELFQSVDNKVARAIVHAVDQGAQVISMSNGTAFRGLRDGLDVFKWNRPQGYDPRTSRRGHPSLKQASRYAEENGVMIFAAMGSKKKELGRATPRLVPAQYDSTIGVTGSTMDVTDQNGNIKKYSFDVWKGSNSHRHWKPRHGAVGSIYADISAPSTTCFADVKRKDRTELRDMTPVVTSSGRVRPVARYSGSTSQAVPYAAGAGALWLSYHGYDNLVRKCGKKNITKLFKLVTQKRGRVQGSNWNDRFGTGVIHPGKLLSDSHLVDTSSLCSSNPFRR